MKERMENIKEGSKENEWKKGRKETERIKETKENIKKGEKEKEWKKGWKI